MICNKAEIHNHLLSEQEECLYCSIDDLQDELSLTRKALELACTRDHFDGEKWILHELDLIKMQGHLNHAMNLLSQAQSGGGK